MMKLSILRKALIASILLVCVWVLPAHAEIIDLSVTEVQGMPPTYQKAMELRQQGDLIGAIQQLQIAEQQVSNAPVLYQLGKAEFLLGEIDRAIQHYKTALQYDPKHAATAYELGSIMVSTGQVQQGIRYLKQSIANNPTFDAHYDLGVALSRVGDPKGAIASLQNAIDLEPQNADAHLNLGLVLARSQQNDQGSQQLQLARHLYQAEIGRLKEPHLGGASLDAAVLDKVIADLDSGCGVSCWKR